MTSLPFPSLSDGLQHCIRSKHRSLASFSNTSRTTTTVLALRSATRCCVASARTLTRGEPLVFNWSRPQVRICSGHLLDTNDEFSPSVTNRQQSSTEPIENRHVTHCLFSTWLNGMEPMPIQSRKRTLLIPGRGRQTTSHAWRVCCSITSGHRHRILHHSDVERFQVGFGESDR